MQVENTKKRVLSGIRATGRLHLGNYLGAVKGMISLQEKSDYETLYMVADAHAVTTPYDPKMLNQNTREVILDYLAVGLDPEKSVIFVQSMVPAHFEIAHYLSSVISVNRMLHLPTYKEKVKQYPEDASMALLNYPVLMTSDILAYKGALVPVGIDQEPHLEIARQIARNMNSKYGTDFPEPQIFETEGKYVPSLLGGGKMSKSVVGSFINLCDSFEEISSRLAKVPTDSGTGSEVPKEGPIKNLMFFVEIFMGSEKRAEYENLYVSKGIRYNELKSELAVAIYETLKPIQANRLEMQKILDDVIIDGAKRANLIANTTLSQIKQKMGFYVV